MNIETYENGVLIEVQEIDNFPIPPNWTGAKIGFLSDAGYQRITSQTTQILAVTRLESAVLDYASGMHPTYNLFKSFWDGVIAGLAIAPTSGEVNAWKAIATNTYMQFTFAENGTMILLEE